MVSSVLSGLVLSAILSKWPNTVIYEYVIYDKVNLEQFQFIMYFISDNLGISGLEVIQRQECGTLKPFHDHIGVRWFSKHLFSITYFPSSQQCSVNNLWSSEFFPVDDVTKSLLMQASL